MATKAALAAISARAARSHSAMSIGPPRIDGPFYGESTPQTRKSARKWARACRAAAVSFPLLFAALTGRSGHGLAPYGPRSLAYSLGL